MPSVKRVVMHSLASTVSPEAQAQRRDLLESIENPLRRTGALALHNFTTARPAVAASFLGLSYRHRPFLPVIGFGNESTVFRYSDEEVLKVNWLGILLKPAELSGYVQEKESQHQNMARYLGDFVLSQTMYEDTHPFLTGTDSSVRKTVHIRQPYIAHSDTGIFPAGSSSEVAANIIALAETVEDAPLQLAEFLDRSRRMVEGPAHLLPDTNGISNLVVDDDKHIRMIDGQPIGHEWEENRVLAFNNLDMLEAGLKAVV